jgi:glutamyl-tRNA reductase
VRTETTIGERQLSLPGVAVALLRAARNAHRSRGRDRGNGRQEAAAQALCRQRWQHGVRRQPQARPRAVARQALPRRSVSFDQLPQALISTDIVVAATASPHALLEARELSEVMAGRGGRPLLLIDLAVPRDIDSSCAEIPGVSLYDIDDLQAVIARNRKVRQAEARKAEGIVEEEIQSFATLLGSLEVLPTLARCARVRPRSPTRCCARTRASGRRPHRVTSSGSTRWHGRSSTACCTTRRRG